MKVKDLIILLKTKNQEREVVTPGFDECGVDDIEVTDIKVKFTNRKSGHCGAHDESEDGVECYLINFV